MPTQVLDITEAPSFEADVEHVRPRWSGIVRSIKDPIAQWRKQFTEWIEAIKVLRRFEEEELFPNPEAELALRMHRGFISNLISDGELLVVTLTLHESASVESSKLAAQVDDFLDNIRSTYELWHCRCESAGA